MQFDIATKSESLFDGLINGAEIAFLELLGAKNHGLVLPILSLLFHCSILSMLEIVDRARIRCGAPWCRGC